MLHLLRRSAASAPLLVPRAATSVAASSSALFASSSLRVLDQQHHHHRLLSSFSSVAMSAPAAATATSSSTSSQHHKHNAPVGVTPTTPQDIQYIHAPPAGALDAALARGPLSFDSYLRACSTLISKSQSPAAFLSSYGLPPTFRPRVHVLFGNEACDMDSMICSLVFGWYMTTLYPLATSGNIFLPLINCVRGELKLRGEAGYAFKHAGLDELLLSYRNDIDYEYMKTFSELRVLMFDHNQLESFQSFLAPNVVAILDHHKDEQLYLSTSTQNRIIEVCGSCTSIVGDVILTHAMSLFTQKYFDRIDYSTHQLPTNLAVIYLLNSVLLLDTSNMSVENGKVRDRDTKVYALYTRLMSDLHFHALQQRRKDISHLTIEEVLCKDTKYGGSEKYPHFISSIPGGLLDLVRKGNDILPKIEAMSRSLGLRFVILLTHMTTVNGIYTRQITILVNRPTGVTPPPSHILEGEQLMTALQAGFQCEQAKLDLDCVLSDKLLPPEVLAVPNNLLIATYEQRNIKGSRKQVAPLVEMILSKL